MHEFSDDLSAAMFAELRTLPTPNWLLRAYGLLVDNQRSHGVYFHITLSDFAGREWPFVHEERLFDPTCWLASSAPPEMRGWWTRLQQLLPRHAPQQLRNRMVRVIQAAELLPDEDLL